MGRPNSYVSSLRGVFLATAPTDIQRMSGRIESSPFARVLEEAVLATPLRWQYLGSESRSPVTFSGVLDESWLRPRWLAPLFHLSSRWRLLFADTGRDIPAKMVVRSGALRDGRPAQLWLRQFRFASVRRFDALMTIDSSGDVIELMGPGRCLVAHWVVSASPDGKEVQVGTTRIGVRLFGFELRVPEAVGGRVHVVERALDEETIHVRLQVENRFLGPIFGYSGTFHVSVARARGEEEFLR